MSTRAVVAAAAAVGAVLAVAAAAVLPIRSGRELAAPAQPLTLQASLTPAAVEFGDPVTARVVVTLAAHSVRRSTLHVVYGVAPLTQLGKAVEHHATRGGATIVTYEVRAACLSDACLATTSRRTITPAAVRADALRSNGARVAVTAEWAPLTVAGRVTPADLAAGRLPFRGTTAPPPATFQLRPTTLAALLDGAAAILAACGAGLLAAALLRARRRPRTEQNANELVRALELVREARARPERDRRSATGYLARLLGRRDAPFARSAGDLAWSRPTPTPDELSELVEDIERDGPA